MNPAAPVTKTPLISYSANSIELFPTKTEIFAFRRCDFQPRQADGSQTPEADAGRFQRRTRKYALDVHDQRRFFQKPLEFRGAKLTVLPVRHSRNQRIRGLEFFDGHELHAVLVLGLLGIRERI